MTPTETLILEVLTARYRLGEHFWPFERNPATTKGLRSLEAQRLIHLDNGNVENSWRVSLTDKGIAEYVRRGSYQPPIVTELWSLIDDLLDRRDNDLRREARLAWESAATSVRNVIRKFQG